MLKFCSFKRDLNTENGFFKENNWAYGSRVTGTFAGVGGGGTAGMIAFGTIMGGAGAALTGGNFWNGAVTGLVVSSLNHAMKHEGNGKPKVSTNSENDLLPKGEITFKDLTKEQLSEFAIIPEHAGIDQIFTPTENTTYEGDGFYQKNFSDKKYWFKVSAGSSVTITNSGGKYNYTIYQNLPMTYFAIALGKDYGVGWQPLSNHHFSDNPFDLKKRY